MASLGFKNQKTFVAFGSKDGDDSITETALTATASDNRYSFPSGGYSKVDLAVQYTMGAAETGNGISLIVEQSPDGENWYRIPNETTTDGTSTLFEREFAFTGNDGGTINLSIGLDIWYKNLRFSIAETGVASNAGSVFGEVTVSE